MAIATTACHQWSQAVTEAFGRRPPAVWPGEFLQVRGSGQICQQDISVGVPASQARDWRKITPRAESFGEARQSVLSLVPANRVDFREISQDFCACKRSKVAPCGDVPGIAILPESQAEGEKILRSALK